MLTIIISNVESKHSNNWIYVQHVHNEGGKMTPDSPWHQHSSFNWGLGWPWGEYLDWVPVSRNCTVKAGELLSSLLELQEGRRFHISYRRPIPKTIFPSAFSQPGNPSSNPNKSFSSLSPHLVLFSRRSRNSWLFLRSSNP